MSTQGVGIYRVTGWDEHPYEEQPGQTKLTRTNIKNTFTGAVEGDGAAEMLMAYTTESSAVFVGFQRITGAIDGRKGAFVLRVSGAWEAGVAEAKWSVVPGSGTGELAGLTGTGGYVSGSDGACGVTLDYDFA